MKVTNVTGIPLTLAVWAVDDQYDYVSDPNYFSVTSLLKPIRQIVLQKRVNSSNLSTDVEEYLARAMGTSIHNSIEKAWTENYRKNLKLLGYSDSMIDRIKINPSSEELKDDTIPIYLEQRNFKEVKGFKIGGKFDFIADGILHDNKSTTTMKWTKGSSDEDYKLQGSLYRWLNQDKVKEDFIRINFIFTDWSKLSAMKDSSYPQHRALYRDIPLLSIQETEAWLTQKLDLISKYRDIPEPELPLCTDEELWRTPTKYKYFANPEATRATKNFDTQIQAYRYMMIDKQGKGSIRVVKGEARRCNYCSASSICSQCKKMNTENS